MQSQAINKLPPDAAVDTGTARSALNALRRNMKKHLMAGAVVWLLFIFMIGRTLVQSQRRTSESLEKVVHAHRVLTEISEFDSLLKDAETSQREYLLTGTKSDLAPYRMFAGVWKQRFKALRKAVGGQEDQQARLIALNPIIIAQMEAFRQTVSLRQKHGPEAALIVQRSDENRDVTTNLRRLMSDIASAEKQLLSQLHSTATKTIRSTNVTLILCTILVALASAILVWRIIQEAEIRRRTESQLDKSSDLLAAILESTEEAIYGLDTEGNCTFVNAACLRMLGYDGESDLLGKNMSELIHNPQRNGTQFDGVNSSISKAIDAGQGIQCDDEVIWRADGSSFPAEYWCHPIVVAGQVTGAVVTFLDITDRINGAAALRGSDERFDLAMRSSNDGLWDWNIETGEIFYSPRWKSMLGYSDQDIEPCIDAFQALLHPEDKQYVMDSVGSYLSGEAEQFKVECRIQRKDKTYVPVLSCGFAALRNSDGKPVRMVGTHVDLTDQKRSEEKLSQFKTTLDQTMDCVFMFRADTLQFFYVNHGAVKQVGYSEEELMQMTPLDIEPLLNEGKFRSLVKPLIVGERSSERFETIHRCKDGTHIPVEISLQYVDPINEPPRFVAIVRDMLDRKNHEQALRVAKEKAEQASRSKSEFLANMSHEIRTPLNGILGFTEVLLREDVSATESAKHMETIRSCGQHLLTLINDILDLSKIEAGQMEFERGRCSPHQVIGEVISILRVRALEKGISLDCCWSSGVPETIETDGVRLRQVLMNLVGNAVKFTDSGSVSVEASIDGSEPDHQLLVKVRDTGIGISEEHLEGIFSPFDQADGSITRKFGGTGLGLTISRKIAQGLGGEIQVESEIGIGSLFTLNIATGSLANINILDASMAESIRPATRTTEWRNRGLKNTQILLCEDGETNRELLGFLLTNAGANVTFAQNGQAGVEAVQNATEVFDLILMDMQMPILDGYSATSQLRKLGYNKPIIALTAHAMRGDEKKCRASGCSGYLTKPIAMDELLAAVSKALSESSEVLHPNVGSKQLARSIDISAEQTPRCSEAIHVSPIFSTLPTDRPQIQQIITKFTDRLSEQLDLMQSALDAADSERLGEIAHWLKGTGGTIGLDCFTEPARSLEQHAKTEHFTNAQYILDDINSLLSRVQLPWRDDIGVGDQAADD